jgi:putative flippase GtrA
VPANISGYIAGLACSFLLNRRWTFAHEAHPLPALLRFLLVFLLSYLLNIGAVLALLHLGGNGYLAHLGGMPLYTIAFYLGCRYFVFPPASPGVGAAPGAG